MNIINLTIIQIFLLFLEQEVLLKTEGHCGGQGLEFEGF